MIYDPKDSLQEKTFYTSIITEPDYDDSQRIRTKALHSGMCLAFLILFAAFLGLVDHLEQETYMGDHVHVSEERILPSQTEVEEVNNKD